MAGPSARLASGHRNFEFRENGGKLMLYVSIIVSDLTCPRIDPTPPAPIALFLTTNIISLILVRDIEDELVEDPETSPLWRHRSSIRPLIRRRFARPLTRRRFYRPIIRRPWLRAIIRRRFFGPTTYNSKPHAHLY